MESTKNEEQLRKIFKSDINKWGYISSDYPTAKLFHFSEWVSSKSESLKELDISIHLQWILPCDDANAAALKLTEAMGHTMEYFLPFIDRLLEKGLIVAGEKEITIQPLYSRWIEKNFYEAIIRLLTFDESICSYLDGILERLLDAQCRCYALWGINELTEYITKYLLKNGKEVLCFIDSNARVYAGSGLPRPVYTFDEIIESNELKEQIDKILICSRAHSDEIARILSQIDIPYQSIFGSPVEFFTVAKTKQMKYGVIGNSVPKSGSNLLKKMLLCIPNTVDLPQPSVHIKHNILTLAMLRNYMETMKRGEIFSDHAPWTEELHDMIRKKNFKMIFIHRDPRDTSISFVEFMNKITFNDPLPVLYRRHFKCFDEKLSAFINGLPEEIVQEGIRMLENPEAISRKGEEKGEIGITHANLRPGILYELHEGILKSNVGGYMNLFLPWMKMDYVYTVKFEDLIGLSGGGTREQQTGVIQGICEHLEIELSDSEIQRIADQVFDRSAPTFRKGMAGGWKERFTPEHKKAFKEVAGQMLIDLGYEKDFDW